VVLCCRGDRGGGRRLTQGGIGRCAAGVDELGAQARYNQLRQQIMTLTECSKRTAQMAITAASMCDDRHRHQEWLKFLRVIDDVTPQEKQIHLIADNYATHKHPKVQKWLSHHPRFHTYFTPTSSSWLNMVERFFRDLTQNRLRRGVFRDVEELIMAIGDYIDKHNGQPKPFIWTAKASDILEKVKRARAELDNR
jgi:transposase